MFVRYICFAVFLAAAASSARAQSPPGADIAGTYYYRGPTLLEIRVEGERAQTFLANEEEMMAEMPEDPTAAHFAERILENWHTGRVDGARRIVFADFQASVDAFLQRYGLSYVELPDEAKSQLFLIRGHEFGRYWDIWEVTPEGKLHIDCGAPMIHIDLAGDMQAQMEKIQAFRELFQQATQEGKQVAVFEEFRRRYTVDRDKVWGWKIANANERAAWQALEAQDFAEAARLFAAAAAAQPDSPFPRFGAAWALTGAGRFDEARESLEAGRRLLNAETRPFWGPFARLLADQIESHEVDRLPEDERLGPLLEKWGAALPVPSDLENKPFDQWSREDVLAAQQWLQLASFWEEAEKVLQVRSGGPVLPIGRAALSLEVRAQMAIPDLFHIQRIGNVFRVRGHVLRAHNKTQGAAFFYTVCARLGQLQRKGALIAHLFGVALEDRGLEAMGDLCEAGDVRDAQTLAYLDQMVSALHDKEPYPDEGAIPTYELPIGAFMSDPLFDAYLRDLSTLDFTEAETRLTTCETHLALLRGACALKRQTLTAPYPESLPGLPDDPFAPGRPLCYRGGAEAVICSVGSDGDDDGARVTYDPTNGTLSNGDLFLRIP